MYLHKWNEALVDWVNCLELTPKISDLSELEIGVFFNSLLRNLIPSNDLSENDLKVGGLDTVFCYLEKEFPLYGVQDIKTERDSKIVYISSLLLLLSVTKGKTPLYCSRLCKDLQHDSQVKIKCFLETCLASPEKLNHLFLKSIIEGDYVPRDEQSVHSPKRVPVIVKTPLKDFLESPRLTDKLSRDLRRLESEKEALQLEKLELEDDLRIEKEKREQLEENLSKKSEQVVKLREELLEYAQNIDELKKGDSAAITPCKFGLLESELKESEKYVKILVKERDMMNEQKNKLKEKVDTLLDKIKRLERRAADSERSFAELQLSLTQKEQELQEIKTHCCELKEKIQLLSIPHNASLDSDTSISVINNIISSPFSEGERLSQAVVDLKLAEVEADNEKLKSQLDLTQEQSQKLHLQLEEVKDKLEKAKIAQEAAMSENIHIQQQLSAYIKEREQMSVLLLEANNNIVMLTETNNCINKDIADLRNKVTVTEELHHKLTEKICMLEEEQRNGQDVQESLLVQLEEERIALANSESKSNQLQNEMTLHMEENKELQTSLQRINEENSVLSNEKTLLVKEISDLKHQLECAEDSIIYLKNECACIKKEIVEKEENLEKIEKQLEFFKREHQTLKERLEDSENANFNLNELLSEEKQKRNENEDNLQKLVESLEAEVSAVKQSEGLDNFIVPHDMSLADKFDPILSFLRKYHLSSINDKDDLKTKNTLLEKDVQRLKEYEEIVLNEKAHCEKQFSGALVEINRLKSHAAQLETNAKLLTEQLTEKNSHVHNNSLSVEEKQELEDLRSDKMACLDSNAAKDEEINRLKTIISEDESKMQSLKFDRDDLVCEKNKFLSMVNELRTTIGKFTMGNEQRDLLHWNSLCELLEAGLKELADQKTGVSDLKRCHDILVNSDEPTNSVVNFKAMKDVLPILDSKSLPKNINDTYNVHDKNYNEIEMLVADDERNVGCQLEIETDINRHLGLENRFWQVMRSGELLEMYMEKLEEKNQELVSKIAALWEVLPKVQSKCNEVFLSEGSSRLMGNEAELHKELCIHLENMLIKMEKHKASLEQEKMHVSYRAVSLVLNGIQFSFEGTPTHKDDKLIEHLKKPSSWSVEEVEEEVSKSLELIEEKFASALIETNSTAQIFKEVECRCSKAGDALEYLKSHGKIEGRAVSERTDKHNSLNKDEIKVLKESYEEMVKTKYILERICRENQDELQKCHIEKETLHEKIDHLTIQNSWLLNELDVCKSKLVTLRQETVEEIQKEFEKKLARLRQKLESAYKDDLEKFSQENQRCWQLEESCNKYKHMISEYQKNLSEMKSHHKNQQQAIETLKKKNTLLEEKIFDSQLNFGVGDMNHAVKADLNRSHSAEHLASYFSRGESSGMGSLKYLSENHLYPLNASTFSKESGRSNLPSGMGQVFCTEDEEGESFNATFLSDLKEGRCDVGRSTAPSNRKTLSVLQEQNLQTNVESFECQPIDTPNRRLNELMRRNTLCLPHLKSSYPAETQIQDPRNFSEDCLKGNSSLKAPLLSGNQPRRLSSNICGDVRRRKDKGQIAYMKPGPPTPGKNRRSSLQGNEQITEHKIQSTPGRILSWFGRRRRAVWDAENIPDTPRMKQKGMLRRPAVKQEHGDS